MFQNDWMLKDIKYEVHQGGGKIIHDASFREHAHNQSPGTRTGNVDTSLELAARTDILHEAFTQFFLRL